MAVKALRRELTTAQLARRHGIHQTMVSDWKRHAMQGMAAVFSRKTAVQESARAGEAEMEKLHAKIGRLLVEQDSRPRLPVDEPATAAPDNRAGSSGAVRPSARPPRCR